VRLWHVYVLAALLGCVTAFDAPARQTFFGELVGEADLANAVALNATSFHSARMIGPALAGVLLGSIGAGWLFLLNAASFVAVLVSLAMLRTAEFHPQRRAAPSESGFIDGLRYVWSRPDLVAVLAMIFVISTFGFNFQLFIPAMAVTAFHAGAGEYGTLASLMAAGSVAGALFAARHARPRLRVLLACAAIFGAACACAALAPGTRYFGAALIACGVSAQIYMTSTSSLVQLSTEQSMRGRVVSLLMAIVLGCTPLGAPLVGWVSDAFGPRWAMAVAAASGFGAAAIGLRYLMKYARRHLRLFLRLRAR
jgi:MFS family permease